jgi:hypothetical protein
MLKLLSILVSLSLTACASIADAGKLVDVEVINRTTGEHLPIYYHHGRRYIEGRAGDRYSVELHNRTGARVLTVLSVDGVNAVTGQTAAANQSGYVLNSWDTAEIAGWRKDLSDVAAFYFTALPDSYAARTGRPDNVGVIGVAVFKEYVEPPAPISLQQAPSIAWGAAASRQGSADSANVPAAPSAFSEERAKKAEEKLGTGHGERIYAPTEHTEFRRASRAPGESIAIYYDSRANLIAQGIIRRDVPSPQPFPNGGFVPDPS